MWLAPRLHSPASILFFFPGGRGGKLLNKTYKSNFCWIIAFALKKVYRVGNKDFFWQDVTVLKMENFLHITLTNSLIRGLWIWKETNGLSDDDCFYILEEGRSEANIEQGIKPVFVIRIFFLLMSVFMLSATHMDAVQTVFLCFFFCALILKYTVVCSLGFSWSAVKLHLITRSDHQF